ncbi:InlB B-repeat-containing protein [Shewanella putrefaciens]|uniref:InlB B-repeat-containing protein n=1 Tax=Shewanella putrefaciens TaxID=24 RepID=UPI001E4006E0|nr:hypothetical protein [Shewanella putrefaciens]
MAITDKAEKGITVIRAKKSITQVFSIALFAMLSGILSGCGGDDAGANPSPEQPDNGGGVTRVTISSVASEGGSILPAQLELNKGGSASFVISANPGYSIDQITGCDGERQGDSYQVKNVQQSCQITPTFTRNRYQIDTKITGNGQIIPTQLQLEYGQQGQFTLTPQTGFVIANVTGCEGNLSGNTYTSSPVTSACTVNASFTPVAYTVTASASEGGIISPESQLVNHGQSASFTLTPNAGYRVDTVSGCDGTLKENTYVIQSGSADCSIKAHFALAANFTNVQIGTQALSPEQQQQPLFLVNDAYAKSLDKNLAEASIATLPEQNQLLTLIDQTGEPLMLGLKLANEPTTEVTVESSAVVFVLSSNHFYGADFTDRAELNRRIRAHQTFPQLVSELSEQLQNGNPCPMDRSCSAVAAIISERIASSLNVDGLLVAGE